MKLHGSDTDASLNGHAPEVDDDSEQVEEEVYDFSTLFDAPNYAEFIKTPPNSKSRYYERRVQAMIKAGMVMSLNNEQWPDAATFLKHGPGFAKAAGNLAAEDARAAKIVDMLTAPDSPALIFAMIAIPMVAQLVRNHQPELAQAGTSFKERRAERKQMRRDGVKPKTVKPPITVHIFKREFKIPIRLRLRMPNLKNAFKAFLTPTQHPGQITQEVFTNPGVIKALHKMGIFPRGEGPDDAAQG